eukprot:6458713-Amphidinium_carterae.1
MAEDHALDLTSMTDLDDKPEGSSPNTHQRRKRRVSGGALSKHDLDAGLEQLATKLEKSFEKFSSDVAKEFVVVRSIAEAAKDTAERAASSADRLSSEVQELRAKVRELSLTPPATPRLASHPGAIGPGDTQANPRRYVITGWKEKTHRNQIVGQVQAILTRASTSDEQIAKELADFKLSAPKVYGKVALIDICKPSQALHSHLGTHFEEQGLRIRRDRPVQERLRSGQLVTVAKTADCILAERSRDQESDTPALKTEICFSDGIVWLHIAGTGHELGRFDRPTQKWTWHPWHKLVGKASLVQVPTSELESWPLNSLSGTQEATHDAVSLQVRTLNLCGFPEESIPDLSELVASADFVCVQEVLVNRLPEGHDTLEYELPGSLLILGGIKVAKLCGIIIPCRHKASIVATHSWSYGLYIDMHVKQNGDTISLRLVCLHLPDSWKELHVFQMALQDLQHVLQTSPMDHLVVAGDWNVEMACCADNRLVGKAATESASAESRLRARLTYEVLDRYSLAMGTTFMDGPSYERTFVATYCHWSSGRAKSLDYVAASTEGFSFACVKDMHADITTTDHFGLQADML